MTFNTLFYAEKLQKAGFSQEQAKAQLEMITEVIENNLATKRDLKELEIELKQNMKELETNLKRDIKESEMKLKIWTGSIMVIAVGILATLQKVW